MKFNGYRLAYEPKQNISLNMNLVQHYVASINANLIIEHLRSTISFKFTTDFVCHRVCDKLKSYILYNAIAFIPFQCCHPFIHHSFLSSKRIQSITGSFLPAPAGFNRRNSFIVIVTVLLTIQFVYKQ